jgi:hypothetical protein
MRCIYPDANGNCKLVVTGTANDDNMKCSVFFPAASPLENNIVLDAELRVFLIGNLKVLFTMLDQDGYSRSWCLYCQLKHGNWTAIHGNNEDGKCNCEAEP